MKKFFLKFSYLILIIFGVVIGIFISNVGNIHEWISTDFGSVAEWFGGIATILVLAITIWRTESANKPRVMVSVRHLPDVKKENGHTHFFASKHFEIYCINYSNRPLPIVFSGVHDPNKWYDKIIPKRWRKERQEYAPNAMDLLSAKEYTTIDSMQQSEKINYPTWSLAQFASSLADDATKKFCVTYMDMYGNKYNSYIVISGKVAKEAMKEYSKLYGHARKKAANGKQLDTELNDSNQK